jgi:integrase
MLIHHVKRYVDYRRKLGVGFEEGERNLTLFARYADKHGDSHVTIGRIREWCGQACSPGRARIKYNLLRRFSMFLRAEDPGHAAPPVGAFGRRQGPRPAPHLLQPEQIAEIMSAALILPSRTIAPYTYHCLFGLLAVTGMRVSEALALQRSDLTRDGLLVRRSKAAVADCCRSIQQPERRSEHISAGATAHFLPVMICSSFKRGGRRIDRPSAKCSRIWLASWVFVVRLAHQVRDCMIFGTALPSARLRPAHTITIRCAAI